MLGNNKQQRTDHHTFLGNCTPTPSLSQHFPLSEKKVLMLAYGRGRWAVSQKRYYEPKEQGMWGNTLNVYKRSRVQTYPLRSLPTNRNFSHSQKGSKNHLHGPLRQAILFPLCLSASHNLFFLPHYVYTCYAGYSMLVTNLSINFVSCLTEETSPTPEDSNLAC